MRLGFLLNKYTVKAFNTFWSSTPALAFAQGRVVGTRSSTRWISSTTGTSWYGPRGFLQYQLVVPFDGTNGRLAIKTVLEKVAQAGEASFLVVCKTFGDIQSPGMLSFPRRGVTLSLDFPYRGEKTLRLLERLDAIVRDSGGAIYPAKDARMSPETFKQSFPRWQEFSQYIDRLIELLAACHGRSLTGVNYLQYSRIGDIDEGIDFWRDLSHCTGNRQMLRCAR